MWQTVQQMGIPTRGRVACHRTLKQAAHLPRTVASLRGIDPHWFGVTGFLVFLPLPCPSSIQVHMSVFQQLPTSKIWMVQENSSVLFPLVLLWFCVFFLQYLGSATHSFPRAIAAFSCTEVLAASPPACFNRAITTLEFSKDVAAPGTTRH